jgi:hypothetical protein
VDRGRCLPTQEAARRCSCVDIISAPRPRLKVESIPMRPPQASQIDTISSSTGILPSPSHCSHNGFRRQPDIAAQALILHLLFNQHLAFIAIRGFAHRARYFPRFFILEFDDELPFGVMALAIMPAYCMKAFSIIQDIVPIYLTTADCFWGLELHKSLWTKL